ncbi:hypothetical protein PLICRDRAFT_92275 [Plicaturopsis crispa FD-325 SS-3]|nr:hypothetical protein PLICRDRAFT_92275 [Plicaturopsis crispa FD-325 SS-3]
MNDADPVSLFFPGEDAVDLYAVLSLKSDAKPDEIKKSYRRHALIYHPDKHAAASEAAMAEASVKFQQIGYAYAVLGDEKRRKKYDKTGRTDEGFDLEAGEDGWESYFEALFEGVTRGKLDDMKREYQGSSEEIEDVKNAYTETGGSIGDIMTYIPHSTHDDEARFIILISNLISAGDLTSSPAWEASVHDEKSRLVRRKQGEKEAKEAEDLARELGVWDEFYGSGKAGARKGKGKGKQKAAEDEDEEDTSALQALILKKKQNMDGFFDGLAAKYAEPERGRKRGKANAQDGDEDGEEGASPKKKARRGPAPAAPDIDDEEFAKLQSRLFGHKPKSTAEATSSKGRKAGKGRKAK